MRNGFPSKALTGLMAAAVMSFGAFASALPPLPGANDPQPPPAQPPPAQLAQTPHPAGTASDVLRQGLVQIERGGRAIGVGAVLQGDGRVLTAASVLGTIDRADIRYADGSVSHAQITQRDRAWDLALLVPEARWTNGLIASEMDPSGVELKAAAPARGRNAALLAVQLKGRTDAKSKEGEALSSALDLDLTRTPPPVGTPIVDPNGAVIAILVHACRAQDGAGCAPVTIGAPVFAVRNFLIHGPQNAAQVAPWLGLGGTSATVGASHGVRVIGVAPGSPAATAGLKPNGDINAADLIVAVDGAPIETPEQLADAISKRGVGQAVKLLVFSAGKFREVPVTLRAAPTE